MPFALFVVSLGGFLIASGYYIYCTFFGARLLARCEVPGEAVFHVDPRMNPLRISAHASPGRAEASATLRVDLECEGSWQWSRDVDLPVTGDRIVVERMAVERPGRYRVKAFNTGPRDVRRGAAEVIIQMHVHEPRPAVYLLAGGMLAGGFVSLLVLLA